MKLPTHLKIAAGSGGAMVFGILFGFVIFPALLKSQLKKEMSLSKKTDVREMWTKVPFALDFKVYLFNYTNAEEVQKGAVPIVKEVGPYYFEEWKEKVEMADQEDEDTITYKKVDTFLFKKNKCGPGLTGEEIIVMPHVFIMSMATVVSMEKPGMLNTLGKALKGIFDDPPNIFLKVKALDILFRGIVINCDRTEFAPKAVCTALKKEGAGLIQEPNNQFRFSLFGARNGTVDPHVFTVKRGMRDVMDVGKVVAVDGQPELSAWQGSCNVIQGTDGTIFPPFLTQKDRLQSYAPDLCRSFKPWFQKKTSYQGIKTNRYVANIGDLANDPELQCYCESLDKCPPKGLMDLYKCIKAPMYASMPHFLDTDPSVQAGVKGLHPDVDAHGIVIDFEPISGTPMEARQRLQFNMRLTKIEKLELCKELPNTIVPLFWIEEGLALNKDFVKMLKHQLFLPKRIVGVIKWLLVAFGSTGVIGAMLFRYRAHFLKMAGSPESPKVTQVKPENESEKEVSIISSSQPTKISA